jgi:hypothetical protein
MAGTKIFTCWNITGKNVRGESKMVEEELVVVYTGNSVEAGFLKGLLEDSGIEVFLKDEMTGGLAPPYAAAGGMGAVKVAVKRKDLDKAKTIVEKSFKKGMDRSQ